MSYSEAGNAGNPQDAAGAVNMRKYGSDVLINTIGQGLVLLIGFFQTLLIPKYLSVSGYGYWQLFVLYSSYVGILHLGFIDGILVRWAGKEINQVGGELRKAVSFLLTELIVAIVPLAFVSYFLLPADLRDFTLLILICAFFVDMVTFFLFTAQAVRKFALLTFANVGRGVFFCSPSSSCFTSTTSTTVI